MFILQKIPIRKRDISWSTFLISSEVHFYYCNLSFFLMNELLGIFGYTAILLIVAGVSSVHCTAAVVLFDISLLICGGAYFLFIILYYFILFYIILYYFILFYLFSCRSVIIKNIEKICDRISRSRKSKFYESTICEIFSLWYLGYISRFESGNYSSFLLLSHFV